MTLLDASCLISLFADEPGASTVEQVCNTTQVYISVLNRAEVIDVLGRRGALVDEVGADIDMLDIDEIEVTRDIADLAARWRAAHYHRVERPISLSDCIALASAASIGEPLATSDHVLAEVAMRVGVVIVPVPNSSGVSPADIPPEPGSRRRPNG